MRAAWNVVQIRTDVGGGPEGPPLMWVFVLFLEKDRLVNAGA